MYRTNEVCEHVSAMSRPLERITRVDIQASGPTGYLHTKIRLPEHLVADLPDLLKGAQALNPAADADALFRTIVRLGAQALRRNNERGIPIRLAELPLARSAADEEARRARPQSAPPRNGLRPSR